MLINLINELKNLYNKGGISNITYENLVKNDIYNDVITCLEVEKIKYDVLEYCSLLIDKHDDYIMYISICND